MLRRAWCLVFGHEYRWVWGYGPWCARCHRHALAMPAASRARQIIEWGEADDR